MCAQRVQPRHFVWLYGYTIEWSRHMNCCCGKHFSFFENVHDNLDIVFERSKFVYVFVCKWSLQGMIFCCCLSFKKSKRELRGEQRNRNNTKTTAHNAEVTIAMYLFALCFFHFILHSIEFFFTCFCCCCCYYALHKQIDFIFLSRSLISLFIPPLSLATYCHFSLFDWDGLDFRGFLVGVLFAFVGIITRTIK